MENIVSLICIPHAGGSASCYMKWKHYLNNNIEFIPVELRGRGKRITEPLYQSMEEAIDDVFHRIERFIRAGDYILFGHSMGGVIAYGVAQKIIQRRERSPAHIILSSAIPPECYHKRNLIHDAELPVFKRAVMSLGGTPEEVFDNADIASIFVPIMRSDYRMLELYKPSDMDKLLPCDMSVFWGYDDNSILQDNIKLWEEKTEKTCRFYSFEGRHFYLFDESLQKVVENINCICDNSMN